MGLRPRLLLITLGLLLILTHALEGADDLHWSELAPLPDSHGFAGPFAGVSGDALIVAGGANFPGGRPWEGHAKVWHDRVFVLTDRNGSWIVADTTLPRPTGYGISLTWRDSVLCLGGGDATTHFAQCYALRWDGQRVVIDDLPDLPQPVAFSCGAMLGDVAYVLGGIDRPDATSCSSRVFALDLSADLSERAWVEIETWPGPARYLSVAGVQAGQLYLFGGVELEANEHGSPSRRQPYLRDAYRFTPDKESGVWSRVHDLPSPIAASPSPAVAIGPAHLFVLGGDDGTLGGGALRDQHQGFAGDILSYHIITDTWTRRGALPKSLGDDPAARPEAGVWPPVTTPTVRWNDRIVVPTGEARPGVRTNRVLSAEPAPSASSFGASNTIVVIVYLVSLIAMGFYFSRREKTTGDFFLGGRRVPWWAAGVSIFGTQLSAITFLAIPAKTYGTDWLYLLQSLGIVAIAPIVVAVYVPFFRRLEVTTAYEYLEVRFSLGIRLIGAVSFITFQLARMGIVMFLPALALTAVTGWDISLCILAMGILCTVYTVLGGIEAVIWTDVLQVAVLMGGALVALSIVLTGIEGGFSSALEIARANDKLRLADFSIDWTGPTLAVILLGAVFNNLVPYTSDQTVVQRYLTTKDQKRAARAVWAGALLAVPASLLFFAVGTALFVFYQQHPERLDPFAANDQIFAWFIVSELPAGVAGMVIAGVFAAAMSSLDSSMNSISAVITGDFYRRLRPARSEESYLRLARGWTIILGVLGTSAALLLAQIEVQSLWDAFLGYIGLLGGTTAGLFALGLMTTRANIAGAWIGVISSGAVLVYAKTQTNVSGLLYAAIGMSTCMLVGYLASALLPGLGEDRSHWTIHRRPAPEECESS